MGFELTSFARTEPTGPATQDSSFVRTSSPETNVAELLPQAAEVMSEEEWLAEFDKIGSV
jgi:hypothetical protein